MSAKKCEIHVGEAGRNMEILKDKNDIFKHKDDPSMSLTPPEPEGGYTNEAIYNKMCSLETLMTSDFHELHLEITSLKNQNQEESEDNESEDDKMDKDESD